MLENPSSMKGAGREVELGVGWGRLECMRKGWGGDEVRDGWERGGVRSG